MLLLLNANKSQIKSINLKYNLKFKQQFSKEKI